MSNDWPGSQRRRPGSVVTQASEPESSDEIKDLVSTDLGKSDQPLVSGRRSAAVIKSQNVEAQLPPTVGWQKWVRALTFGAITPRASKAEILRREDISRIQRIFPRPVKVLVAQPLGGNGKTMNTVGIASTFGIHSTLDVLAWCNNESMGTLGVRTNSNGSTSTVIDLLQNLSALVQQGTRKGDLSYYTRHQGNNRFSALVSDEDPERMKMIGVDEFTAIRKLVETFYNIIVLDSGNNLRAENFLAALDQTDQLVIPVQLKDNSVVNAFRLIEQLESMSAQSGNPRYQDLLRKAVVIVTPGSDRNQESITRQKELQQQLEEAIGVEGKFLRIPYDPQLDTGSIIDWQLVSDKTRRAYERICAEIADGMHSWATNPSHQEEGK